MRGYFHEIKCWYFGSGGLPRQDGGEQEKNLFSSIRIDFFWKKYDNKKRKKYLLVLEMCKKKWKKGERLKKLDSGLYYNVVSFAFQFSFTSTTMCFTSLVYLISSKK